MYAHVHPSCVWHVYGMYTPRYFTVAEAEREAALLGERCQLTPIRSAAGHRAGDPSRPELAAERAFLTRTVRDFLREG